MFGAILGIGKAILGSKVASSAIGAIGSNYLERKAASRERGQALEDDSTRFIRMREGLEAAGYHPLSQAMHGNTTMGLPSGQPSPIGSATAFSQISQDFGDLVSGREAQRAERSQLENDLARVRIDQAIASIKSGEAQRVGGRASSISAGRNASAKIGSGVSAAGGFPVSGYEVDPQKFEVSSGMFGVDNDMTAGRVYLPGEGEPWGIDEVATAVLVGGPQVAYNYGKKAVKAIGSSEVWKAMNENAVRSPENENTASIMRGVDKTPLKPTSIGNKVAPYLNDAAEAFGKFRKDQRKKSKKRAKEGFK